MKAGRPACLSLVGSPLWIHWEFMGSYNKSFFCRMKSDVSYFPAAVIRHWFNLRQKKECEWKVFWQSMPVCLSSESAEKWKSNHIKWRDNGLSPTHSLFSCCLLCEHICSLALSYCKHQSGGYRLASNNTPRYQHLNSQNEETYQVISVLIICISCVKRVVIPLWASSNITYTCIAKHNFQNTTHRLF